MKIAVAMSGGVDSSVVAHLLHEQGHEVIGIMMKLWTDPLAPESRDYLPKKCCSIEHIQRARAVCNTLQIPFYIVNLEEEFKEEVINFYLEEHKNARTPNPCVVCNRTIKFGALLRKVEELGFTHLATGHYANVREHNSQLALFKSKNDKKDQSYYLYQLSQETLAKILLPLGDMPKDEVFALAKKYAVPLPEYYRESEDLCFYPESSPEPFLQRYIPEHITPGPITLENGTHVGSHRGLPLYTFGQRRGLNIGGLTIPLHVKDKDIHSNTLIVSEAGKDMNATCFVQNIHWINEKPVNLALKVRTSSLGRFHDCSLTEQSSGIIIHFTQPVRGLAPGQSAVFYDGERVLGGGIISR
jgi:tRNA-uridine 2-sulfurtransferase